MAGWNLCWSCPLKTTYDLTMLNSRERLAALNTSLCQLQRQLCLMHWAVIALKACAWQIDRKHWSALPTAALSVRVAALLFEKRSVCSGKSKFMGAHSLQWAIGLGVDQRNHDVRVRLSEPHIDGVGSWCWGGTTQSWCQSAYLWCVYN